MQIGDQVRVVAPFNTVFPDVYTVEGYQEVNNSWVICGDREFEEQFLEVVSNGNNNP